MKTKTFMLIALLLAVFTVLTACSGKKTTPTANNSTPGISQGGNNTTPSNNGGNSSTSTEWPNDEVGNLVSKPSFDYKVKRYLVGEGRKILTVEFPGATKEQMQSYFETILQEVGTAYPDADSLRQDWNSDSVCGGSFSFKNETGMSTMVSLKWYAEDDAELMIEWVLK